METPTTPPYRRLLLICINERPEGEACCARKGGKEIFRALKARVAALELQDEVRVTRTQCLGLCERGVNVCVMPDNIWLHDVRLEDVDKIVEEYVEE